MSAATTHADALAGVVLALDASSERGSAAVVADGRVLAEETVALRSSSEERLMPAVAAVLRAAEVAPARLTAVVCGAGPGSFTGLRIAAAIAKGTAHALGIPLYAAPSLELLVAGAEPPLAPGRYLALLDALRGERFALEVTMDAAGRVAASGAPALLGAEAAAARAASAGLTPVGPGEALARWPHARGAARLLHRLRAAGPVTLAAWHPDYGRLAEAQAKWEAAHGRALPVG